MSAAQRKAVGQRMKKYWAARGAAANALRPAGGMARGRCRLPRGRGCPTRRKHAGPSGRVLLASQAAASQTSTEQRSFWHITENWHERPLRTFETVVELIAHTTTAAGSRSKPSWTCDSTPTARASPARDAKTVLHHIDPIWVRNLSNLPNLVVCRPVGSEVGEVGDLGRALYTSRCTEAYDPPSALRPDAILGGHPKPAINGQLKTGHFE